MDPTDQEYLNELTSMSILNSHDFDSKNLLIKCKELGVDAKLKNKLT